MIEKRECTYCRKDLRDGSGISVSFWNGVTLPEKKELCCDSCHTMRRIVADATVQGIRDFMAQYIFTYYYQSERLNGKIESPLEKRVREANAKV